MYIAKSIIEQLKYAKGLMEKYSKLKTLKLVLISILCISIVVQIALYYLNLCGRKPNKKRKQNTSEEK